MAKQLLYGQTTSSRIEFVRITDMNASPITGLVYNSSGLAAKYVRPGAATQAITLATQTVTGAYSSGGFVEVDSTAMPGVYRFDIPNAAFASGVDKVIVSLYGYTGMNVSMLEYEITAFNPQDGVSLAITALPAVAAGATNGLPLSVDSSGRVDISQGAADKVFGASGAAMAELSAVPSATPSPRNALMLMFMSLRNKLTTTSSSKGIYNDAGTQIASKALSDSGTTYTEDEMV